MNALEERIVIITEVLGKLNEVRDAAKKLGDPFAADVVKLQEPLYTYLLIETKKALIEAAKHSPNWNGNYPVVVADNHYYQDKSHEFTLGEFDSEEEAIAEMKARVDKDLAMYYKPGISAKTFWENYIDDSDDPRCPYILFDAWRYAKERIAELCGSGEEQK
jgi:hypothetical protein